MKNTITITLLIVSLFLSLTVYTQSQNNKRVTGFMREVDLAMAKARHEYPTLQEDDFKLFFLPAAH